ncbi:murein L,D-transpeptidase YafK [Ancylobacter aquaticus]|uniref:Murein L,D-transpeptidase YafK n=1 Tax=Ancylobacter aquaticus TaxID=100 RepID=A0A4R1I3A6_ANCAQ|nr:murein L,D-transpeptidase family protein [Ancylobacter aquaticus]TCK28105.1 murein L,D-transpeptidase YafK [Ancylobacter aquaticus]
MNLLRTVLMFCLAAFLAGCASMDGDDRGSIPIPQKLMQEMAAKGMSPDDPIMVRIYKQESELEVWKRTTSGRYALLKTYPLCRWSGKLGPKTREGDRQAPEGFYTISRGQLNPRSQYYLSFNLGYPNALERALGYSGSALMVHGACTSAGCYAMTNDGVGEVYALAREALAGGQPGFQVQSLPFRMTPGNMAEHRANPNMPYWRNLKEGTDLFAVTRVPPNVSACGGRYSFTPGTQPAQPMADPLAPCPMPLPDAALMAATNKQMQDEHSIAMLAATRPPANATYVDGGMHPSFRDILRRSGPQKLAAMTSGGKIPVSEPTAALADPYKGAEQHYEEGDSAN